MLDDLGESRDVAVRAMTQGNDVDPLAAALEPLAARRERDRRRARPRDLRQLDREAPGKRMFGCDRQAQGVARQFLEAQSSQRRGLVAAVAVAGAVVVVGFIVFSRRRRK